MLNWLFSRPLQVKFFFSTLLLVSAGLLALMLSVLQILDQFLSHQIQQDMQQRSHILAMTLMVGPAAHDPNDLRQLLQEVSEMHGYCYLTVQDTRGELLAAAGDSTRGRPALPGKAPANDGNACLDEAIPLVHDGKPFGTLHYGVNTDFLDELELALGTKLFIIALLWLAIGASVHFFLVRRMVQPLREITRASQLMANGNLNAAMPKDLPQDELGKLATSFSNMATVLRQRVESQQRYAHDLYAEQARLNALISILPVGVMFVGPARHVQFINQECRRLWGLSESEDYIGHQDTELIGHARGLMEQPDTFMRHIAAALEEYGISAPFDTPLRNGRIIRSRSCVVPDAAGEHYIGRMWMFEDVSEEYRRLRQAQTRAKREAPPGR